MFSSHDVEHNNAVVLKKAVERLSAMPAGRQGKAAKSRPPAIRTSDDHSEGRAKER